MTMNTRVLSIDIMRGLTLFLMLFVNDLYEPGVPQWLVHTKGDFDGMGLADWVFPGFLFMVGMSIPYAVKSRRNKGETDLQLLCHIVLRTLSLLLIGILMLNSGRLNPELTGINRLLWAFLMYVSVFLVWNQYAKTEQYKTVFLILKIIGIVGLGYLIYIFKAGDSENIQWLEKGWWGILGLIGWGYFTAAIGYLLVKDRIAPAILLWLFFVGINILSQLGMLGFLRSINPILGVITAGNVPSIVLSGLVIGMVVKTYIAQPKKLFITILCLGFFALVSGFVLRHWFVISKIWGTPSWAMVCNGVSMIVFALLYYIVDVWKKVKWAVPFDVAGKNSLTTYLAPDLIYFVSWGYGLPIFFYKQEANMFLAVSGSIVWAFAMIGFAAVLSRINIKLKL